MFDVITFGSATKDIFLSTKKGVVLEKDSFPTGKGICFSLGSKIRAEEIYFTSGGGGTNTAATFAKQGLAVAYCGKAGKDSAGEQILKELKKCGVDTRFVSLTSERPTNHSVILDIPEKDRTIFVYQGASDLLGSEDIPFDRLKTRWVYIAPLSVCAEPVFYRILNHAIKQGVKVMANPSKNQLRDGRIKSVLRDVDVLLLNMEEASILTNTPYNREEEIMKKVIDISGDVVIITQGVKGAVAHKDGVFYSGQPLSPEAVDRTGAGDSFGSGFLSKFIEETDVEKSLQLGIANSTACLQKKGAKHGLLKKNDFYEKADILKSSDFKPLN